MSGREIASTFYLLGKLKANVTEFAPTSLQSMFGNFAFALAADDDDIHNRSIGCGTRNGTEGMQMQQSLEERHEDGIGAGETLSSIQHLTPQGLVNALHGLARLGLKWDTNIALKLQQLIIGKATRTMLLVDTIRAEELSSFVQSMGVMKVRVRFSNNGMRE